MMIESQINPEHDDARSTILSLIQARNHKAIIHTLHYYLAQNPNYSATHFLGMGNIEDQKGYYLHRELQWYEQQLEQHHIDLNYWDLLCLCCSKIYQNYQWIIDWYKQMLESKPEKQQINLGLANFYYNNNKFDQCQPYFLNVIRINPNSEKGYQLYSFLKYFKYEHDQQAIVYIQKCLEINPDNIYAQYLIAVTQQEPDKQVQLLTQLANKYPFYARTYLGFYFHYMYRNKGDKEQNLRKAQFYCNKALQINPLYDNTYESMANICKKRKQFDQAKIFCFKALQMRPNQDNPYNVLGNIQRDQEHYQQAIQFYKLCIEINPINFHALFNLGLTYDNLNNYQKALQSYKRCLEYKPTNYDASYNLALLCCQLKDKASEIKYYELCISINPKEPNAYYNLGVRCIEQQEYEKAITYFQKTIQASSEMHKAYYNIGDCLINLNRHAEAIPFIKKSLEIQENNILYSISLVRALMHLKIYDEILQLVENTKKNLDNFQGISTRNRSFVQSQLNNFYGHKSDWQTKVRLGIHPMIQKLKLREVKKQFQIEFTQFLI